MLLSNKGHTIRQLTAIFSVCRITIYNWFDRWQDLGRAGLTPTPGQGRKSSLASVAQPVLEELVAQYPQNLHAVVSELATQHAVECSKDTLRRHLKKGQWRFTRVRNSLKSKRNPEAFARASTQLAQLRGLAEQGYLDLFYYDESRFSLVSNVPRAWQAPHAPIALPATRGPGINVAGFLRHDGTSFGAYTTTQSIKSVDITLFFNDFCQQLTQPTVVVLDNASCHRSAEVSAYLAEWEEQGLRLFFSTPL